MVAQMQSDVNIKRRLGVVIRIHAKLVLPVDNDKSKVVTGPDPRARLALLIKLGLPRANATWQPSGGLLFRIHDKQRHRHCPIADAELVIQILQMVLDCVLRNTGPGGNLQIGPAIGEHSEQFQFARRQA